jgi:hypothetical protein
MRYFGLQNEVKNYLNRLQRETSVVVTPAAAKTLNDRVESLKKAGTWSQYSLGFNDVDGDVYLTRASVTDLIGRAEVLWFIRGMKALGLYQNMVAWPMRSYQNAGTGSTVYSLGGLGIYNGNMVNSPAWGRDGINLLAGQYISTTAGATQPDVIFCSHKVVGNDIVYDGSQRQHIYIQGGTIRPYAGLDPGFTTTTNNFETYQVLFSGANSLVSLNGAAAVPKNLGTNNLTSLTFGRNNINNIGGITTFTIIIQKPSVGSLHTLYKSTLGSNLSLP